MSQKKTLNLHTSRFIAVLICSNPPRICNGQLKAMYNTQQLKNILNKIANAPTEEKPYVLLKNFGRKISRQGTFTCDSIELINYAGYANVDLNKIQTVSQVQFDLLNDLFIQCEITPPRFEDGTDALIKFAHTMTGRTIDQHLNKQQLDFLATSFYLLWDKKAHTIMCDLTLDHDQKKHFDSAVTNLNQIYGITMKYVGAQLSEPGEMYAHLKKISDLDLQTTEQLEKVQQAVDVHNQIVGTLFHTLND
jgi:hypothetical protein